MLEFGAGAVIIYFIVLFCIAIAPLFIWRNTNTTNRLLRLLLESNGVDREMILNALNGISDHASGQAQTSSEPLISTSDNVYDQTQAASKLVITTGPPIWRTCNSCGQSQLIKLSEKCRSCGSNSLS